MKKLLVLAAVLVLVAPALAREFTPYEGSYPATEPSRADIELQYDGELWYGYGTSPDWTDESVVLFQAPAGGPFTAAEARYFVFGMAAKDVHLWNSASLWSAPSGYTVGPSFNPNQPSFPPSGWTTVDLTGLCLTLETGAILGPGCVFTGGGDGIGLADAYGDGVPGHSWVMYGGGWEDDTYVWYTDDGIRLGLNYGGGSPTEETTWGTVKNLFR